MGKPHSHICNQCGHKWVCMDPHDAIKPLKACPVTKAAKVNGVGPFCQLCYHLIMAIRTAEVRKLDKLYLDKLRAVLPRSV